MAEAQSHWQAGVDAFADSRWFTAHEHWEDLWRGLVHGDARRHLQGFIHMAVSLYQLERGNVRGAAMQAVRAARKLGDTDPLHEPPAPHGTPQRAVACAHSAAARPLEASAPLLEALQRAVLHAHLDAATAQALRQGIEPWRARAPFEPSDITGPPSSGAPQDGRPTARVARETDMASHQPEEPSA